MTDEVNGTQLNEAQELDEAQRLAGRVAARAEILDVRLLSTTARLIRQPEGSRLSYELKVEPRAQLDDDDDGFFVVLVNYFLTIDEVGDDKKKSDPELPLDHVATLEFTHAGLFQLNMRSGDEPASAAELDAYARSTGYFALYPYSREYIYNTTGRLGLPPLTVEVLRLHAPFED